jgi:hypothetical protein
MTILKSLTLVAGLTFGAAGVSAQSLEKGMLAAQAGDFETALKQITPLAEQGNDEAQAMLGALYKEGKGVQQDYVEAEKWIRLSAVQGNAKAQMMLGALYAAGLGVNSDQEVAAMWFLISAVNGEVAAVQGLNQVRDALTPEEMGRARALAVRCFDSVYKDCSRQLSS